MSSALLFLWFNTEHFRICPVAPAEDVKASSGGTIEKKMFTC